MLHRQAVDVSRFYLLIGTSFYIFNDGCKLIPLKLNVVQCTVFFAHKFLFSIKNTCYIVLMQVTILCHPKLMARIYNIRIKQGICNHVRSSRGLYPHTFILPLGIQRTVKHWDISNSMLVRLNQVRSPGDVRVVNESDVSDTGESGTGYHSTFHIQLHRDSGASQSC